MRFRTECDWSVRLQRDCTAHHRIELKLYDVATATSSSVFQTLSIDLDGVYRDFHVFADENEMRGDYDTGSGRNRNSFSFKLRDLPALPNPPEPRFVVVTFVQDAAVNRLGAMDFYLLSCHGSGLQSTASKVVVHLPPLLWRQIPIQWISERVGRSAYPMVQFDSAVRGMSARLDASARTVQYVSPMVTQGSGVAFTSRFSINVVAWIVSSLITLGIGVAAGIIAAQVVE